MMTGSSIYGVIDGSYTPDSKVLLCIVKKPKMVGFRCEDHVLAGILNIHYTTTI